MEIKLEKKYGLITAICMVVGIVIGSGVFFKAQTILTKTAGDMPLGILAWIIGGVIMLACILAFSIMASKYEKVNGIVDYAEATVGKRYAYNVGWFMTTIYYPTLTSVLAWLSARYTLVFITSVNPDFPLSIPVAEGGTLFSPECLGLMMVYLCAAYALNALSPRLAGKFQVSATVIKLIPLALMAVVGLIYGLANGILSTNFATTATVPAGSVAAYPLFAAVVATAFAYEGWIVATSINAELRNAKRNLPLALILGGIIVMVVYISYYVGVAGGASNQELIDSGATVAFIQVFGSVFGNVLNLFIAISCMGTMNGLMLGCCRGLYSIAVRGQGPAPETFSQIDDRTNMPTNSSIFGLLLCAIWGFYFYAALLSASPASWVGKFIFDSSELPIVTIYAMYLPIFIIFMKKATELGSLKRYIIPALALIGSCFMVYASVFAHGMENVYYLILFAVIMIIGNFFYRKNAEDAIAHKTARK